MTATAPEARVTGGETAPLVDIDHLEVVFETRQGFFRRGAVHAINDVSLSIASGETVAVVGESGSGKTTLGRASLRLVEATGGAIRYDGRDITHLPDRSLGWFRKQAQIVFQDPFSSLNPYMRVYDLVEEPLIIDGVTDRAEREQRIDAALAAVDLHPPARFGTRYPTMMSGGQRQRVGIARALVRDPRYIVADEPVSMIDASSRISILDLLRGLQLERGVAFLYITHDIASARHFSDRIAVMYLGEIVEIGRSGAIIDRPRHPYTQALLAAIPEPDPSNRFIRRAVATGEPPNPSSRPIGCPFFSRCPHRIPGTCDVERPPLIEMEPGIRVACHLYPAPGSAKPGAADHDDHDPGTAPRSP
jgi:oligopeptide/dipeptide ABC transporter ATP-binding protein